ncbi:unnamed protein product [marine sediment metagenome]|uniref:Uncharacterized protein n=1 Tax=marine sediment metagenome TaxID=412755 RepID=X1SZK6_9ZZZZ
MRDLIQNLKDINLGVHKTGSHVGTELKEEVFSIGMFPYSVMDFYIYVSVGEMTVEIRVNPGDMYYMIVYSEVFTVVDTYKRRVIFPSATRLYVEFTGSAVDSECAYTIIGSHLSSDVAILE